MKKYVEPMKRVALPKLSSELTKFFMEEAVIQYEQKKDLPEYQRWSGPPKEDDPLNLGHFLTFDYQNIPELDEIFAALPWPMLYTLTLIKNVNPPKPAQILPHIDRSRKAALIYYMTTGGPDVYTTFIDAREDQKDKRFLLDMDFEIYDQAKAEQEEWYVFPSDELHGVTNVENTRIMISCQTIDRAITYDEFIAAIPHLIVK